MALRNGRFAVFHQQFASRLAGQRVARNSVPARNRRVGGMELNLSTDSNSPATPCILPSN